MHFKSLYSKDRRHNLNYVLMLQRSVALHGSWTIVRKASSPIPGPQLTQESRAVESPRETTPEQWNGVPMILPWDIVMRIGLTRHVVYL